MLTDEAAHAACAEAAVAAGALLPDWTVAAGVMRDALVAALNA
jgi:hypothetical protein